VAAPLAVEAFELDDVRAEVAEDLGREGALHERGEVEDPEMAERAIAWA
jgi:hypothetical protein